MQLPSLFNDPEETVISKIIELSEIIIYLLPSNLEFVILATTHRIKIQTIRRLGELLSSCTICKKNRAYKMVKFKRTTICTKFPLDQLPYF